FACDWAKRRRDGRVKTGVQLGVEASSHYNLSYPITFWESSSLRSPPRLSSIGACGGRTPEVSTNTFIEGLINAHNQERRPGGMSPPRHHRPRRADRGVAGDTRKTGGDDRRTTGS